MSWLYLSGYLQINTHKKRNMRYQVPHVVMTRKHFTISSCLFYTDRKLCWLQENVLSITSKSYNTALRGTALSITGQQRNNLTRSPLATSTKSCSTGSKQQWYSFSHDIICLGAMRNTGLCGRARLRPFSRPTNPIWWSAWRWDINTARSLPRTASTSFGP